MIAELHKLSRPELVELYHDRMVKVTKGDKRLSLLSMSAAYFLVLGNFSPFKNNSQAHFFNSLAEHIYDSNPHSILIQKSMDMTSRGTKPQVIEKIGSMGIENMNKENFNRILSLYECIYILYNIYVKDASRDMEELMANFHSIHPQPAQKKDHAEKNDRRSFFNAISYYQFLCNKLNDNGFPYYDFDTGRLSKWKASKYFMANMNGKNRYHHKAFHYLKEHEYFNMGICPACGGVLKEQTYTYYSTINPKVNYPICQQCYLATIRQSDKASEDKRGCYIATACYGDFNSVEVQAFRAYRDQVLCKSVSGRLLISLYYFFSSSVARYLKESNRVNNLIKVQILDKIYKRISTKKKLVV